jgi:hypothetical protein
MKTTIFSLTAFLLITSSFSAIAQENPIWDYPIKPGTEEWAALSSGQERLAACQIPQEILETLNSKDLARICIEYPRFLDYISFNDERAGIRVVINNFNGLTELSNRNDGAKELLELYKNYPILNHVPEDRTSRDFYSLFRLPFLELILADELFLGKLNNEDMIELEKLVVDKYERKLQHIDVYGLHNIKKTFLIGARVVDKQNKFTAEQQEVVKRYIENYTHPNAELLTEISEIISQL